MSVIVSRALPDVRDGLKPVHRRILYAMGEMGLSATSSYRKCAAIVGEVMGKYHPHGDSALYDALVRLAQDFSMRYPLVDGQGNFGSVDGDTAAAMRYTEARLTAIAGEMLADIDKDTVDFVDNYDGTQKQPSVLPAKLPNLLVNGRSGIAVGMATNIPPHHLGEIVDATIALIDDPELTSDDLCKYVKGPDFPTGGTIYRFERQRNALTGEWETVDAIRQMYAHGRGRVVMRAQVAFEEVKGDRTAIVVTELPYQVNKASLLEKIAELVKDKRIEGIGDLRDESDRDGMRIYIELKRDANPHKVLNNLFKHTPMQLAFNMNMLALVDGQPQTLPLRSVLVHYLDHRREIIRRRTEFDLGKARARAHILEGLKIALDNLDAVIKTIRESAEVDDARTNLMKRLRPVRAPGAGHPRHAAGPPGRARAPEDRGRVPRDHPAHRRARGHPGQPGPRPPDHQGRADRAEEEVRRRATHPRRRRLQPRDDRRGPHRRRGRRRHDLRPRLHQAPAGRHVPPPAPRRQGDHRPRHPRGGRRRAPARRQHPRLGAVLHEPRPGLQRQGPRRSPTPAARPRASRSSTCPGSRSDSGEVPMATIMLPDFKAGSYLVLATRQGIVKKTPLEQFEKVRSSGIRAITIRDDDELAWVDVSTGEDDVIIATAAGQDRPVPRERGPGHGSRRGRRHRDPARPRGRLRRRDERRPARHRTSSC